MNNEDAIARLRSAVLRQMSAAHSGHGTPGAAAAAAADAAPPPRASSGRQGYDSDDYEDLAGDADDDVIAADRMARAAAARLDNESIEYIQHHLPGRPSGARGGSGAASGDEAPPRSGQGRGGGGGRRGRGGRGGRDSGVPQPAVGGRAPRLRGDTAIGRAVEARSGAGGAAVAVLREGKSRLFEAGSPMVGSWRARPLGAAVRARARASLNGQAPAAAAGALAVWPAALGSKRSQRGLPAPRPSMQDRMEAPTPLLHLRSTPGLRRRD
jgi:hypothetical protein